MEVTNQPTSYPSSKFQTGLFDGCKDCKTCCYGFFCFTCFSRSNAKDMKECCCCGFNMGIRGLYRTKYNIRGDMCRDYLVYSFCTACAVGQMKRDIDLRKQQGIF